MATKKNTASEAVETAETAASAVAEETTAATAESDNSAASKAEKKEATYTADEFANAASKVFGKKYSPDLVRAAFIVAGKKSAPKTEAQALVKDFAERKVK